MRLSDSIDKPGFFWLPNRPEQQYPGTLHVSESGEITLRIVHRPTAVDPQLLHGNSPLGGEPPRILGIVDNNPITLEKCVAADDPFYFLRVSEGYVSESKFGVGAAFVGASFVADEPIAFSRVDFSLENLNEWFSISGFRPRINSDSEKADWSLHYTQPDGISMTLPDGIQLQFVFSPSFSLPDYKVSQLSSMISQRMHVSLASDDPLPVERFFIILHRIHTFLCLVMSKIVAIEWVKGYSRNKLDKWNREVATDIFYHSQLQGQRRDIHASKTFGYNDISSDFEETILRWLAGYETIHPAVDLYLSSKIGAHKYLNGVFLSLIQGLESLHRRTTDDTEMKLDDFDRLRSTIIDAIPPDKRKFVESRLTYANEISLRKRLKRLIEPFEDLFGTSTEIKSLVQDIVDVRNYLTHHDKKLEPRAKRIGDDELHKMCLKLDALFQLHFLKLTGMDTDRIRSMARGNRVLRHRLALDDSDE